MNFEHTSICFVRFNSKMILDLIVQPIIGINMLKS